MNILIEISKKYFTIVNIIDNKIFLIDNIIELIKIPNKYCIKVENLNFENNIIEIVKEVNCYWKDNPLNIISFIEIVDNSLVYFNDLSIHKYITDNLLLTNTNSDYKYLDRVLNKNVKTYLSMIKDPVIDIHTNINLFYLKLTGNVITQKSYLSIIKRFVVILGFKYNKYTIKEASKIIYTKLTNEKMDKYESIFLLAILEIFLLDKVRNPLCKIINEDYILEQKTFHDISYDYEDSILIKNNTIYKYGFKEILIEYDKMKSLRGPYPNIILEKVNTIEKAHNLKIRYDYINTLKMINDNNEERLNNIQEIDEIYVMKISSCELLSNFLLGYRINILLKEWKFIITKLCIFYFKVKSMNKIRIYHQLSYDNIIYDHKSSHFKIIDFKMTEEDNLDFIISVVKRVILLGVYTFSINKLLINNLILRNDVFLKEGDELIYSLIFLEEHKKNTRKT